MMEQICTLQTGLLNLSPAVQIPCIFKIASINKHLKKEGHVLGDPSVIQSTILNLLIQI